jgi:hypothetical protein
MWSSNTYGGRDFSRPHVFVSSGTFCAVTVFLVVSNVGVDVFLVLCPQRELRRLLHSVPSEVHQFSMVVVLI